MGKSRKSQGLIARSEIAVEGLRDDDLARVRAAMAKNTAAEFRRVFRFYGGKSKSEAASCVDLEEAILDLAEYALTFYEGFCALANRPSVTDSEVACVATSIRARQIGAQGGAVAAAKTREVREFAVHRAEELAPKGGWSSAPQAAEAIAQEVAAFGRTRGRNPSRRKLEEWLRAAGIKRCSRT